jgi:hypothetical protein
LAYFSQKGGDEGYYARGLSRRYWQYSTKTDKCLDPKLPGETRRRLLGHVPGKMRGKTLPFKAGLFLREKAL